MYDPTRQNTSFFPKIPILAITRSQTRAVRNEKSNEEPQPSTSQGNPTRFKPYQRNIPKRSRTKPTDDSSDEDTDESPIRKIRKPKQKVHTRNMITNVKQENIGRINTSDEEQEEGEEEETKEKEEVKEKEDEEEDEEKVSQNREADFIDFKATRSSGQSRRIIKTRDQLYR